MSIISLDKVFRTFCKPSMSYGSFGLFFLESSLKETFLAFLSSKAAFFSKELMCFSTSSASFIISAKVGFPARSTKMAILAGRAVIYHSLRICSLGLEAVGILLRSLLKRALNSLMGSLCSILKLERSFIRVAKDLSSPFLVRNCSWHVFQSVMDPDGREKYQDPADPCKV